MNNNNDAFIFWNNLAKVKEKSSFSSLDWKQICSEADVNYELQMAHMNKELNPEIETIFLPTNTKYSFISSSLIKEVLTFDADVKNLVPEQVLIALKNKNKGRE